ncbi:carbohydrate ABC transporter permease [Aggregicoccus sp. 17bor-14]|uniref:carbohydrate ABC transporter permease n=1 Tax=Myxococcaceae TaxID=31 RepID=UPI0012F3D096|nr:carbohydrate ABC transporter permease [Simulacricoccus sp. 17bor-14]MRI92313.1 carbohydrate ABC transporter permease [Aggregicoccus sp. 17bor-14]
MRRPAPAGEGPGLARALACAAFLAFFLGPFAWQLLTSLRPEDELTRAGLPTHLTLASYASVLAGGAFLRAVANSLLLAAATTAFCLAVGASAAFALAKLRFPGSGLLLALALGVSMFPPIATVSPLYLLLRAVGLRDRLLGLVLPYATFALPLTLWLLTSFFRELPDALYRAARVDGCTPFGAFWRVLLPLAAPGLATTGLLVFIFCWNEFLYALTFLSSPERRTVPVALSLFAGEHVEPWGEVAAASLVATLPLAVLTLLFQRRIVSGLTSGAVKE